MATKQESVEIAVLQNQMSSTQLDITEIKGDIKEIKGFMQAMDGHYITRNEFAAFKRQYWLSHTLTAVLTAIVTYLAAYFILGRSGLK